MIFDMDPIQPVPSMGRFQLRLHQERANIAAFRFKP